MSPSFRLLIDVEGVLPGVEPPSVEQTLVDAVAVSAFVEAHDLDIVGGVPRLRVRFLVPDSGSPEENAGAARIGRYAVDAVRGVAVVRNPRLLRRTPRNRWLAVALVEL